MRKLAVLLFILLIFSCGKENQINSSDSNLLENLTLTLDTVRVDVGDELFIAGAYGKLALHPVDNRIFLEYPENLEIHEIDLNQQKLIARHSLAKDGPDRAPSYVQGFQLLGEDEFFLFSQSMAGIYNLDGRKLSSIGISLGEIPGLEALAEINYFSQVWLSPDRQKLMAIPYSFEPKPIRLAVVDLNSQTGKLYDLSALDITLEYQVRQTQSDMMITSGDFISTSLVKNQLAISSSTRADFYLYDAEKDSLTLIQNPARQLPNQKTDEIRNQVETQEERWEVNRQLGKMVNYRELFYDDTRGVYFRLATINGSYDAENRLTGYELWLLSYDQELNLTGEKLIRERTMIPFEPFFKDGKLYSFTVLEEDPGFVVWDFDF